MKKYEVKLTSIAPLVYGKFVTEEKLTREGHDAYEKRTWEHRQHIDADGNNFIPELALKNSLSAAAKYLSEPIPNKGKSTFTKHFEAGIVVEQDIILEKATEMEGMTLHVPSDGMRGGSKRVLKTFPTIQKWEGTAIILVYDEIITKEVLYKHLTVCGRLIGIMSFRPRNNGNKGTFSIASIKELKTKEPAIV